MPKGLIPEAFVQQSELVVWTDDLAATSKYDRCAICQESFSAHAPDICRVLDCHHVFHAKCVDLWFIKATFCPLCKNELKSTLKRNLGGLGHSSSQRSSPTSSARSLGSRSYSSSLRSGQILVGHSNSDPALLGILQVSPGIAGTFQFRSTQSTTPDRHGSAASLFSDRSLPVMAQSPSERSLGVMSSSSSGPLPVVQEVADEARSARDRRPGLRDSRTASPCLRNASVRPIGQRCGMGSQTLARSSTNEVSPPPARRSALSPPGHRPAVPIYVPAAMLETFVADPAASAHTAVSSSGSSSARPSSTPSAEVVLGDSLLSAADLMGQTEPQSLASAGGVAAGTSTLVRLPCEQRVPTSGASGVASVTRKASRSAGPPVTVGLSSHDRRRHFVSSRGGAVQG